MRTRALTKKRTSARRNFGAKFYKKTSGNSRRFFAMQCTRLRAASISVTTTDSSQTAPSRHTQIHTYRCFRQDLTRFVRFMLRKNPSFNTSYCGQAPQKTPSVGNSFQIQRIYGYRMPLPSQLARGGEKGIRTPDTLNHVYPLSRRAPSTNSTISPCRLFYKVFNLT